MTTLGVWERQIEEWLTLDTLFSGRLNISEVSNGIELLFWHLVLTKGVSNFPTYKIELEAFFPETSIDGEFVLQTELTLKSVK